MHCVTVYTSTALFVQHTIIVEHDDSIRHEEANQIREQIAASQLEEGSCTHSSVCPQNMTNIKFDQTAVCDCTIGMFTDKMMVLVLILGKWVHTSAEFCIIQL